MIKIIISSSLLILITSIANLSVVLPVNAQVQKCQDVQGKWHYGNDLRGVCKNESSIKSVKGTVKSTSIAQGESASDQELAKLELKVLDKTEYLNTDLEKILSPYKTKQDIDKRFARLKTSNTEEIVKKEQLIEGLRQKEILLKAGQSPNNPQNSVELADTRQRIKTAESDLGELQVKAGQIDQRRTKVLTLFDQFSDKFGPNAAS